MKERMDPVGGRRKSRKKNRVSAQLLLCERNEGEMKADLRRSLEIEKKPFGSQSRGGSKVVESGD